MSILHDDKIAGNVGKRKHQNNLDFSSSAFLECFPWSNELLSLLIQQTERVCWLKYPFSLVPHTQKINIIFQCQFSAKVSSVTGSFSLLFGHKSSVCFIIKARVKFFLDFLRCWIYGLENINKLANSLIRSFICLNHEICYGNVDDKSFRENLIKRDIFYHVKLLMGCRYKDFVWKFELSVTMHEVF